MYEIKNFEDLIRPHLRERKLVSIDINNLLSSGENYGSVMLAVRLKVKNGVEDELIDVVAKMCPPSGWLWDLFNIPATFKKEVAVYNILVPTLQQFQIEQGMADTMNFFAKCYGARISLDPISTKVDEDATLLLENLITEGFKMMDRFTGFDLQYARFIMKDLAVFHAVALAYRLQHPEKFEKNFMPYLKKDFKFNMSEETMNSAIEVIQNTVCSMEGCSSLKGRIEEGFKRGITNYSYPQNVNKLWGTMTHNDYWVNNTMLKVEGDKPIRNVMVDFQLMELGSPANDVIFFLFSSVENNVLSEHYEDLLNLYYKVFIDTLTNLKCDTKLYSFESFCEEIDVIARDIQFFHLLIMLKPIFTKKEKAKDLAEFRESDMVLDSEILHRNYSTKLFTIVREFAKRSWI